MNMKRKHSEVQSQRFPCPNVSCDKVYQDKSAVKKHMEEKYGERQAQAFPCPMADCGKTYASRNSLRRHTEQDHADNGENTKPWHVILLLIENNSISLQASCAQQFFLSQTQGLCTAMFPIMNLLA